MPRSSTCRVAVAFVLAIALIVPCARAGEAASPRSRGTGSFLSDLLDRAWGGLVSLWAENGCIIDPNGGCAAGQGVEPTPDNGCIIDPDGRCAAGWSEVGPQPAADNGCILDPNGGCRAGS